MSEDVPSLKKASELRSLKPVGVVVGYKRVRTKWMWGIFGISLIFLLLGVALLASPPMSSKVVASIDDTLQPRYYYRLWFVMEKGEKIEVKGTVTGGNNDIWIYVKEGGRTVKSFGKVKSPIDVVFTAPEDGNYTLYIDNSISVVTSKTLHLEVIKHYYDYGLGAGLFVMGIILVLGSILILVLGQKRLVLDVEGETYEFWFDSWGRIRAAINGVALDEKLKPGMKFKIGPNDEHLLEIKKVSWRKVGFLVDGQEVGRLP